MQPKVSKAAQRQPAQPVEFIFVCKRQSSWGCNSGSILDAVHVVSVLVILLSQGKGWILVNNVGSYLSTPELKGATEVQTGHIKLHTDFRKMAKHRDINQIMKDWSDLSCFANSNFQ